MQSAYGCVLAALEKLIDRAALSQVALYQVVHISTCLNQRFPQAHLDPNDALVALEAEQRSWLDDVAQHELFDVDILVLEQELAQQTAEEAASACRDNLGSDLQPGAPQYRDVPVMRIVCGWLVSMSLCECCDTLFADATSWSSADC